MIRFPKDNEEYEQAMQMMVRTMQNLNTGKFKCKESLYAIEKQKLLPENKEILVPLSQTVYATGYLSKLDSYLVDIGCNYIVEMDVDKTVDYFERRIKFIDDKSEEVAKLIHAIVESKHDRESRERARARAQARAQAKARAKAQANAHAKGETETETEPETEAEAGVQTGAQTKPEAGGQAEDEESMNS